MPIIRRTTNPSHVVKPRWTHEIQGRHFTAGIRVVDRKVIDAEPQLHWTIGQRYDKVVELSNARGDEIIKIEKDAKP